MRKPISPKSSINYLFPRVKVILNRPATQKCRHYEAEHIILYSVNKWILIVKKRETLFTKEAIIPLIINIAYAPIIWQDI